MLSSFVKSHSLVFWQDIYLKFIERRSLLKNKFSAVIRSYECVHLCTADKSKTVFKILVTSYYKVFILKQNDGRIVMTLFTPTSVVNEVHWHSIGNKMEQIELIFISICKEKTAKETATQNKKIFPK